MADDPKILDPAKIQESTAALTSQTKAVEVDTDAKRKNADETRRQKEQDLEAAGAKEFYTSKIGEQTKAMFASVLGFKGLGESVSSVTGILEKFGLSTAMVGTQQGRALINPVSESGAAVSAFSSKLGEINAGLKQLVVVQNVARQSIVMLGGSLADGDAAASKYPDSLRKMAGMLSISTKELNDMSTTLRDVPGMMDTVSGSMTGIGNLTNMAIMPMAVLATTMTAFGMNAQQSAEFGRRGMYEYGQSAEQTFKQIGLMADAQKQTGISGKVAVEQIEQASKGLAIFGQGSAVAASTWTTFQTALKGSGVPIGEVGKMVADLTGSFANMSLQTKAAISSFGGMGGGKTALGGALQMEINMRTPGGLEKNMDMMTSTLSKFGGGKIITLQEAASNPQLESQFVVQRQMLGKLSGIQNTEQQNRILETMQNVQRGGMSQVEGGKSLEDAFEKGKDVQTQQLTAIEKGFQLTQAAIGNSADKIIEGTQGLLTGGASPEERERGADKGASLIGKSYVTGDKSQRAQGIDTTADVFKKLLNTQQSSMDIQKKSGPSTMDVGDVLNPSRLLSRRGLRSDSGIEKLSPEAKLVHQPTYAAISPAGGRVARRTQYEGLATATKPSESPLFKIVGTLQKSDDSKVRLMEQMLATLQQGVGREMPQLTTSEFTLAKSAKASTLGETDSSGKGSVITVKIIGDEKKVMEMVTEALSKKSLWPIGHTD